MQLVDGSSDSCGKWCRQQRILFVSSRPPDFLCGPSGEQTGGTAFHRFFSPPCLFASVPRWRTKGADLMPRVRVLPRVIAG